MLESLLQRTTVPGKFPLGAPQSTFSQLREPPDNLVLIVHQIKRPPTSFRLSSQQNLTRSRQDGHPRPASPSQCPAAPAVSPSTPSMGTGRCQHRLCITPAAVTGLHSISLGILCKTVIFCKNKSTLCVSIYIAIVG